jgi:hypothetical protein
MRLDRYVDDIARQLALAADAISPEAGALAERLTPSLQAAMRLALLDALGAAAEELTLELAPGSVEVRLRGGEPSLVVAGIAPTAPSGEVTWTAAPTQDGAVAEPDEGPATRINLRMPDSLKARVEAAALREGRSVNAWLVRAATAALATAPASHPSATGAATPTSRGARRVTGWAQ